MTTRGVQVITDGAPTTGIDLALDFRPNVLKGEVTGGITGVGITPSAEAYSAAVLIDAGTGETVGIDTQEAPGELPIACSIPFSPTEIDRAADYVVQASIVDGDAMWANTLGVPRHHEEQRVHGHRRRRDAGRRGEPVAESSPLAAPADEGGLLSMSPWLLLTIIALIAAIIWLLVSRRREPPRPTHRDSCRCRCRRCRLRPRPTPKEQPKPAKQQKPPPQPRPPMRPIPELRHQPTPNPHLPNRRRPRNRRPTGPGDPNPDR